MYIKIYTLRVHVHRNFPDWNYNIIPPHKSPKNLNIHKTKKKINPIPKRFTYRMEWIFAYFLSPIPTPTERLQEGIKNRLVDLIRIWLVDSWRWWWCWWEIVIRLSSPTPRPSEWWAKWGERLRSRIASAISLIV